jgi:hypothetical protein
MARIEITDLPVHEQLTREEQQDLVGGWSWGETQSSTYLTGVRGGSVDPSDPSAGTQNGIIAILIG